MSSEGKQEPRTFSFRELTIWRTKLPDVKFGALPPSNNRPNPLATQDRLYVSVFFPGAICALRRDHGKLIWRRDLPKHASASVHLHEGKLFAKTSNTLFALRQDSGETLWSFCPYGNQGESIYSSPSAEDNRVYIGDRRGYLYCLDADSGETIWKRLTNRARNSDVNSTPILMNGMVIVSTNARTAVAYEAVSGRFAWRQELDGPSTFGPLVHQDSVLVVSDSLYLLNPKTGRVKQRFSWGPLKAQQADTTSRGLVVTFWPDLSSAKLPSGKVEAEKIAALEKKSQDMALISASGVQRTKAFTAYCPCFRYAPTTRLLYLSHLHGVDVFRPTTGTSLFRLSVRNDTRGGIAPVDVRDEKIYVLTGDGQVHGLQHPA
jgi:outer membrane protein assembly factor BamB